MPSMAGGGAERQLTYLCRELVTLGWDVHVAFVHGGPNLSRLEASGATVHRLAASGNYDPRILSGLVRVIRAVKPDVMQCWLLQMEVLGGLAARWTRTPWVFSERASEQAYPRTFKMWLRRKIGSIATAIVSNSRAGDQYWQRIVTAKVRRYIIPNGIPLEEIDRAPTAHLTDAPAASQTPILLNAGRFEYQKNFETFVRALHIVARERAFLALCCGEGPLRGRIEALATELALDSHVRFAGYAPNLWALMKRADLVVSTSFFEGSPNVVLEAMACGCPLVVSEIPTHREILDEETAVFVNPGDPQQIARTLVQVLNDREGATRRAAQARARVQRYSLPAVAREYARVYGEISNGDDSTPAAE